MAHANNFQYLEDRYNAIPLVWSLKHSPVPGVGVSFLFGDNIFWEPEPINSLVAQIDARTRRNGVKDDQTGDGTNRCQQIQGIFGYLAVHGNFSKSEFLHQGGSEVYGEGFSCDFAAPDLGDNFSFREGEDPTWEWIFEQLQKGRGVVMSYGRYNIDGDRTGGHMLRVWGAMRFNGIDYLYTLDDGNQGDNNDGLRTTQWEVKDVGGPGEPGVPDGRLNLDGTTWEIEFAMSVEAKPTLVIP
jgi:hypothetical protein